MLFLLLPERKERSRSFHRWVKLAPDPESNKRKDHWFFLYTHLFRVLSNEAMR